MGEDPGSDAAQESEPTLVLILGSWYRIRRYDMRSAEVMNKRAGY
jgi:hypothetical protein